MNRRLAHLLVAAPAAVVTALWPRAAGAAEGGLEIFPDPVVLAVLIAIFLLMIFPLDRLLFRPLLSVLDERRIRIQGARERAEAIAADADEVLGRYQRAVGAARAEAENARREILDEARRGQTGVMNEARGDAEAELVRARREVAEALAKARGELRGEADALASEAAARLLGRPLA